jgi:hypothetical protein
LSTFERDYLGTLALDLLERIILINIIWNIEDLQKICSPVGPNSNCCIFRQFLFLALGHAGVFPLPPAGRRGGDQGGGPDDSGQVGLHIRSIPRGSR